MVINSIKHSREKFALTQEGLAKAIGVSRQTVNAIETGKYEPSLSLALKMAAFFKQPVEKLFILNPASFRETPARREIAG